MSALASRHRDARLEARDRLVAEPGQDLLPAIEARRHDQVRILIHDSKRLRHDADDLARRAVHLDDAPDDMSVATEAPLPVPVAQKNRRCGVWRLIGFDERTTQHGRNGERLQHAVGDDDDSNLFGFRHAGNGRGKRKPDADVFERPVLVGVREVHRHGQTEIAGDRRQTFGAGGAVPDRDQIVGPGIGEWFEEDGVDDAEDRRVRADADRERQQGRCREGGAPPQGPRTVSKVAGEVVEPRETPLIAQRVHGVRGRAVRERRGAPGRVRLDRRVSASADSSRCTRSSASRSASGRAGRTVPRSRVSHSRIFMTSILRDQASSWSSACMMDVRRSHSARSAASCRRPAAVIE